MPRKPYVKLTDAIKRDIIEHVRNGAKYEDAALACGVSEASMRVHREKDSEFSESIKKARAEAVTDAVTAIKAAYLDNWQAAAWFLERTNPSEWGRTSKVVIEGGINVGIINQAIRAMTDAGLDPVQAFMDMVTMARELQEAEVEDDGE